jgi:hypothetical protein
MWAAAYHILCKIFVCLRLYCNIYLQSIRHPMKDVYISRVTGKVLPNCTKEECSL